MIIFIIFCFIVLFAIVAGIYSNGFKLKMLILKIDSISIELERIRDMLEHMLDKR